MGPIPDCRPPHYAPLRLRLEGARRLSLLASCALIVALVAPLSVPVAAQAQDSGSSSSGSSLGNGLGSVGGNGATGIGSGSFGAGAGGYGGGFGGGVLPNPALGGGLVNLRDLVESPLLQTPTQPYDFRASIGAFFGYTDNASLAGAGINGARPTTFERITPTLTGIVDLSRLQGTLTYNPSIYFYNSDATANRVNQALSSTLTASLVEDAFFVRASAFASQVSTSQLATYNGVNSSLVNNTSQAYSGTISPYFVHQFADVASLNVGYQLSETYFDNSYQNQNAIKGQPTSPNTTSASQTEYLTLSSGSDFQVFQHSLQLRAAQFYANGFNQDGHRNTVNYLLSYAVNRLLTAFGEVGYEDLSYASTSVGGQLASRAYNVSGLTGQGGLKFTPTEDSLLSISYGHYDGGNSLLFNARLHPTERISLIANSSTGVTTNGQDLANYTAITNSPSAGASQLSAQGTPLGYALGTSGTNPAPYRLTRSSISAIYALERDTFVASFVYSQQQNVASVQTTLVGSSNSTLGSLSWQHQVSESTSLSATGNYGVQSSASTVQSPSYSNPVLGAVVRLSDALTESLMVEVDYIYAHQRIYGGLYQNSRISSMNEVYAGLTKRF